LRFALAAIALLALSACQQSQDDTQQGRRVAFAQSNRELLRPIAAPDTTKARWIVNESGQAIHFGNEGEPPMLTLDCRLADDPPQMRIIRHVRARPGQGALFPVIGNGMISRFLVDAKLEDGEWRWEGTIGAANPMLDVFTGPRPLTATLPGGGLLAIAGSRVPGEFVTWCRAGRNVMKAEADEQDELAADAQAQPPAGPAPPPPTR